MLRRALGVGWAHIHGDRLDLGRIAAVLAQRLGEGSEGLCALHHEEQTAVLSAKQIGHAAVPAPDARGLVLLLDGYVDSRGSKLGHHLKNGSGRDLGRSGFEPLKA